MFTPSILEREEQFYELVECLKNKALLPGLVLHHCLEACNLEDKQQVAQHLNRGIYTLFYLCRALMKLKTQAPQKIISVFSSHGETPDPLGAAIAGFFKTLTLENPKVHARVVEIQSGTEWRSTGSGSDRSKNWEISPAEKAVLIWDEVSDTDWTTKEISYRCRLDEDKRRQVRYVGELAPYTFAENDPWALPLRPSGVYLITGGLGGLGFIFGEYLARNYQAKLVLVGRSAPGAKHEERIDRLTRYGAEVLYLQADVSELEDMRVVVRQAKARFSQINGVIHAAGINRDAFVLKKTREEMDAVLAPKVYGAINVDLATSGENLDLFVLFSSVAGVMGNVGTVRLRLRESFPGFVCGKSREPEKSAEAVGPDVVDRLAFVGRGRDAYLPGGRCAAGATNRNLSFADRRRDSILGRFPAVRCVARDRSLWNPFQDRRLHELRSGEAC